METSSPNVFHSRNSEDSLQGSSSSKVKIRLSEIRYTPTRNAEDGLATFMLDICQDSLEIPRPKSRLIEFTQIRDGEEKPRQVMIPLFFHAKKSPSHQRQASLKPVLAAKESAISEILMNLREKPKPKSSLKNPENCKKQKTVSFCSQIELSSPENPMNSVIYHESEELLDESLDKNSEKSEFRTTANSLVEHSDTKSEKIPDTTASTQQNIDFHEPNEEDTNKNSITFEVSPKFRFEEEIRTSLGKQELEFNEFSTVAFCGKCESEVVTAVSFEKVRGQGCGELAEWILCWAFPACMYKNKKLVHKCPNCGEEIAKLDW